MNGQKVSWEKVSIKNIKGVPAMIRKKSFPLAVIFLFLVLGNVSCREAGGYRLKKMTPSVQQALNNRKARSHELQARKAKSAVGENNQGFVRVLKPAGQAKDKDLVAAENRDRNLIYNIIAKQNHLGPKGLSEVERAFAKVRENRARHGDWIQNPQGKWIRK